MSRQKIIVELDQEDELELRAYAEREKISLSFAAQILMETVLYEIRRQRATECWDGVINERSDSK